MYPGLPEQSLPKTGKHAAPSCPSPGPNDTYACASTYAIRKAPARITPPSHHPFRSHPAPASAPLLPSQRLPRLVSSSPTRSTLHPSPHPARPAQTLSFAPNAVVFEFLYITSSPPVRYPNPPSLLLPAGCVLSDGGRRGASAAPAVVTARSGRLSSAGRATRIRRLELSRKDFRAGRRMLVAL